MHSMFLCCHRCIVCPLLPFHVWSFEISSMIIDVPTFKTPVYCMWLIMYVVFINVISDDIGSFGKLSSTLSFQCALHCLASRFVA